MSRLSFKIRLFLALLGLVALLGVVGLTSYLTHRDIQSEVAVLCARRHVDLREVDLTANGLEMEGTWDPAGVFIAHEVEVFPGQRRPKLRGRVQALDLDRGELTLYGRRISLPSRMVRQQGEALARAERVEVTCDVEDGTWRARKLDLVDVKESDKIKACPTSWELDGVAPESVEIHGIRVSLAPGKEEDSLNSLHHVETATALSMCLHELRAQAVRLVGARSLAEGAPGDDDLERDARLVTEPEQDLLSARDEFEHYLTRARPESESDADTVPEPNRQVAGIFEQLPELDRRIEAFLAATRVDMQRGREQLTEELAPFLEQVLEPRIDVYLRDSQDDLGDRVRAIEESTHTTARVTLALGVVATLTALALGFMLWRTVQSPLVRLEHAAERIGRGELGSRVEIDTHDEFGALATAFNHMSERLATTTVSVDNLQNILDSMTGSLILLSPEKRIGRVNRAAARLLGYEPHELIGRPFAEVCREAWESAATGSGARDVSEHRLLRKDGSELAVSFSAAELRDRAGASNGWVVVAQDLSDQKRVEQDVRTSLQEKELMLREVHHRVKNNMQVVSSVLAMQQSCAEDPTVVEGLEQGQARIRSMALIHEHLYQSTELASADVAAYLDLLVTHIAQSFGAGDRIELEHDIAPLDIDLDQALALGLIVNELLANSYRHAFPAGRRGRITLQMRLIAGETGELTVRDDGASMDPDRRDDGRTLGLQLVRTLVRQLDGEMRVTVEGGVTTRITFPCNQLSRVAS